MGCSAEDLSRFICSSLNAEIRRKNWRELLKYYYSSVNDKLDGENKIDYDQVNFQILQFLAKKLISWFLMIKF